MKKDPTNTIVRRVVLSSKNAAKQQPVSSAGIVSCVLVAPPNHGWISAVVMN
jgi:hypothetical protein